MRDGTAYDALVCFNLYLGWRFVSHIYAEVLHVEGLSPQRLYVLGLCRDRTRTVGDLAEALHIDSQAISNLLRRMERDGLIARHRDDRAKRQVLVEVTDHGWDVCRQATTAVQTLDRRIEACLDAGDVEALRRVVGALENLARPAQISTG